MVAASVGSMSIASAIPFRKFFPTRNASAAPRWLLKGKPAAPLRVCASAAGSAAGEYSERLPGMERVEKKKKSTVAGIDQEELVDPSQLADPDSFFCDFNGVRIHHKVYQGEHHHDQLVVTDDGSSQLSKRIKFPFILLHGFGASVYSWGRVMKPLARLTTSKVLAFDRPAFGLTSRAHYVGQSGSRKADSTPLNPYSLAFSVLATLSFVDSLGSDKTVLVGHSAGCIVAANTYFDAPERIAALILVAPAIVAPLMQSKPNGNKKGNESQEEDHGLSSDSVQGRISSVWKAILRLMMGFISLAMEIAMAAKKMINAAYRKLLSAALRSSIAVILVRMVMDKFGILAVRNAWYDASKVTDHVIQGYTKPLRSKGWEMALLEHTLALLTDSGSESKPPLTERLSDISCPVLIVTGDADRIVPAWNAKRLAARIPGSTLAVIKNCGHLPHEERVDEFVEVVSGFLEREVQN